MAPKDKFIVVIDGFTFDSEKNSLGMGTEEIANVMNI